MSELSQAKDSREEGRLAERALEEIAQQQPKTLAILRKHGVVFDGPLGADPKNFQHVAFSIYNDLCEVDSIARSALAEIEDLRVSERSEGR